MVLGDHRRILETRKPPGIPKLNDGEILINAALADELGASVGDLITVALPAQTRCPCR